jgi:hypothetical protein
MKRGRSILAVVALAGALGAAWWLNADRLTAEEKALVGTWRSYDSRSNEWSEMRLLPDRQYYCVRLSAPSTHASPSGRWSVRNGTLIVDLEASTVRRAMRQVADRIGVVVADVGIFPLASVTSDEFVISRRSSPPGKWTRVRGE